MKAFFKNLFDYNYTTSQKLWDTLDTNRGAAVDRSLKLYSHILNAHQIWNNRIEPRHATFDVWQMHDLDACRDIDTENHAHTLDIINTLDLTSSKQFTMRGKKIEKVISDVLFHVINHSTYHRGQIATDFRLAGIEPLRIDFILYESSSDV